MPNAARATRIVATLGPASDSPEKILALARAGVNVFRLNFSHGTAQEHEARAAAIREAAATLGTELAILADLQGPKIRVGGFADGKVMLEPGQAFQLDASTEPGDLTRVGLDYPQLIGDLSEGDLLLLNDGLITMRVESVADDAVQCRVEEGGVLSNRKGINRKGGGLSAPALSEKDKADIITAAGFEADYVAVSFPKDGADIETAKALVRAAGSKAGIIAKIERAEAIDNLQEIILASAGIMVARGDLAVEVGEAAVPALQKRMIQMAREANRLTITATQMMESMISSPAPTRAEVSDVANAVLDGTDAVMLSAETAAGDFPVRTVQTMARVCLEAEKSAPPTQDTHFVNRQFSRIDQSIAMAAVFTARHLPIRAVVALTESGSTALWLSRLNLGVPVYALTPNAASRRKMCLFRSVQAHLIDLAGEDRESLMAKATGLLQAEGLVSKGDLLAVTVGDPLGTAGGTNTLKVLEVGAV